MLLRHAKWGVSDRVQKILSAAGVASRRRAEELIRDGRVAVNGRVANLGDRADLAVDDVRVDGERVNWRGRLYIALHKPVGYVTSTRSTHGENIIYDLSDLPRAALPVGRLDKESSGLLLMTNDGEWANLITHPRYQIEKVYHVTVRGHPDDRTLHRMRNGVLLPDGTSTAPAQITQMSGHNGGDAVLLVGLIEGKKRQIRLMAAAVGHPVLALTRIRIGSIELGSLPTGTWRHLRNDEVESIRETAHTRAEPGSAERAPASRD